MGGRKQDLSELPELPQGLTVADLADRLSEHFGRPVTAQQVHHLVVKRRAVPVGRRNIRIDRPRFEEVIAVAPEHLDELRAAYQTLYLERAG